LKDIEHQEQVKFVTWLETNYPEHRVFAIPNGGKRGKIQAMKLKQEGVRRGVPDLFIPSLKLFVEMKKPEGGRVSKEQKDWLKYLTDNNYNAVVANGFEQAKFLFLGVLP
jgi:hypothetical protein